MEQITCLYESLRVPKMFVLDNVTFLWKQSKNTYTLILGFLYSACIKQKHIAFSNKEVIRICCI